MRAYHAGDKFYAEVNIIMEEKELLRVTNDVSQTLQRKLEGTGLLISRHLVTKLTDQFKSRSC
ncbi:MAG: hypothetical protein CL912_27135 [Deltaproteobacteria bacterium]|nr:hypothetical protein [Deltaproteobacteria bacterium]